jgi:hypothetical protein
MGEEEYELGLVKSAANEVAAEFVVAADAGVDAFTCRLGDIKLVKALANDRDE